MKHLMHISLILASFCVAVSAAAQVGGLSVQEGTLTIASGSHLSVAGSLIAEDRLESGPFGLTFTGSSDAEFIVDGEGPILLTNFRIDKPAGQLLLSRDVTVTHVLDLAGGSLDQNGHVLLLAATVESGDLVRTAALDRNEVTLAEPLVIERYYQTPGGWRFIGAPFEDVPFTTLNDAFHTQGANNTNQGPGSDPILFTYDATLPLADRWQPVEDYAAIAESGMGYLFYMFPEPEGEGDPYLPGRWIIEGNEPTGPFTHGIPYDDEEFHASFSLLSNPFAAPLDWDEVHAAAINTGATYYVWDAAHGAEGAYRTYQTGGIGDASRYIASLQGIFVFASGNGASVTFDRSMKTVVESPVILPRPGETNELHAVGFELSGGELASSRAYALVGSGSNAPVLTPFTARYASLWFDADEPYLYLRQEAEHNAPAVFELAAEVTEGGVYTLFWPDLRLPEIWTARLTNQATGTTIELREQQELTLSIQASETARFTVELGPTTVSDEDGGEAHVFGIEAIWPNPTSATSQIAFTLEAAAEINLEIFDVLGRRVMQVTNGEYAAGRHVLPLSTNALASGVYVARLTTGSQMAVRRVTVVR